MFSPVVTIELGAWNPFDSAYAWSKETSFETLASGMAAFDKIVSDFGGRESFDGPALRLTDGEREIASVGVRVS